MFKKLIVATLFICAVAYAGTTRWNGNGVFSGTLTATSFTGQIDVGGTVTGTLPYSNGGTGQSSVTQGDLLYGSATNVWSKLAKGTTGQWLMQTATIPAWTSFTAPKVTTYTSGSGTHTFTGSPLAVRFRLVGGGGGGSSTSAAVNGGAGGSGASTTIDTTALVAGGGGAGGGSTTNGPGGAGGSSSKTIGAGLTLTGGNGTSSGIGGAGTFFPGGMGGSCMYGGGGRGGEAANSGSAGTANTGGGGGGGGSPTAGAGGGGGGAGGCVDVYVSGSDLSGLSGDVAYSIGTGGSAGGAGTSGTAGGVGGTGSLIIVEFYQ